MSFFTFFKWTTLGRLHIEFKVIMSLTSVSVEKCTSEYNCVSGCLFPAAGV